MKSIIRYAASLALAGALAAPIAVQAVDKDKDHDRDDRVYDRAHRDYHYWTPDEDRVYHEWYGQTYNGRAYRDYRKLNRRDQERYWNWRHSHEDRDHDRGRH